MFFISPEGFVVDQQGFPANSIELYEIEIALGNSLALSKTERVNLAKQHCRDHFPEMSLQVNWETFE